MLYKNTVAPETLELLNKLMGLEALQTFALVGGTNHARWRDVSTSCPLFPPALPATRSDQLQSNVGAFHLRQTQFLALTHMKLGRADFF
ncbi:MAG TPA: hypothetical protein VK168_15370 [Saprospiraceae bacterium]|nr:hypothetical protein [Saprospiraceae bacterium]